MREGAIELLLFALVLALIAFAVARQGRAQECGDLRPWLVHRAAGCQLEWVPASGCVGGYEVFYAGEPEPFARVNGPYNTLPNACPSEPGEYAFEVRAYHCVDDANVGPRSCPSAVARIGCYPDTDCSGTVNATDFAPGFSCAYSGACRLP